MHHGEVMPMLAFVNDALMAVFFFVIGLEIKQEILIGELSSVRKALLPIIAPAAGWIVPVLFYFLVLSFGTRSARCGYSDGDRYRLCLGCFRLLKTGSTQHAYFFDGIGGGG